MMILFPSLSPREIIGFSVSVIGLILAAGGGIGGGGILMPIYILILEFPVKRAIPLVNVTVFGGAIANTILNVPKRHPLIDRPLVDWDLILVMEPLTMAGALLGAVLAKLLPSIVLIVSLVAVLSFTAYKTLQKAMQLHQKETKQLQHQQRAQMGEATALLEKSSVPTKPLVVTSASSQDTSDMELLDQILEEEKHVPWKSVIAISALFLVVATSNILKGGGKFPSPLNITCGSLSYLAMDLSIYASICIVALYARGYLLGKTLLKSRVNYPHVDGDMTWNEHTTLVYPLLSMVAGFTAGLFGLGGGIVTGPLMIAMGVNPSVSSATTAVMILFTSFTATTSFVVFGLLDYSYAFFCITLGFFATLLGQWVMSFLLQKFKRQSFIVFVIGFVVAISCFLMTVESVLSLFTHGDVSHKQAGLCNSENI